ncbi:MAG: DUF378 domain-containing protein [Patescibacteria group bacterium]
MSKPATLDWIAIILLIIGGLNWGIIGFLGIDYITAFLGDLIARIVYIIVGLSAIYVIIDMPKMIKKETTAV